MKKLMKWIATTMIIGSVLAFPVRAAESASVLLQKGIFAEETEGNLDAAIKIYQKIADDAEANRSVMAQAQYRLGVCQVKKGKKDEAESAFRRIVEQFTDQTDLMAKTRERLRELGSLEGSVVIRQIWSPKTTVDTGSVTSDGRYLSFTDWTTGDLAVRDLTTGQNRRLTDKGPLEKSSEFAETSVFSPDGKQLAYGWYPKQGNVELRILSLDDPKPRVLMTNPWVRPEAWSPKGDFIAAVTDIRKRECAIHLVSTADGSVRKLKSLPFRQPDKLCFSPDGRYLAYSCPGEKSSDSDIYLLDITSGSETTLVGHPADDKVVAWAAEPQRLLFKSDRRGSTDLWAVQVQDGKTTGEPVLLKSEIGDVSILGITQGGALYYGISRSGLELYQTAIDLNLGKVLSPPQAVPHSPSDGVFPASLSPNGRYLAYYSSRRSDWPELFVSDLETRQHRHLYTVGTAQRVPGLRWLSDNKTLVHRGDRSDGSQELALIDRQSGAVTALDMVDADAKLIVEIAGDGQTLVCVVRDVPQKAFMMVRRNLATGKMTKTVLLKERDWSASYYFKISPDLRAVVYTVVPTERSAERPSVAIRRDLDTGQEYDLVRENSILMPFPSPDPSLVAVAGSTGGDAITVRAFRLQENQARELWTAQAPGPIYFPTLFGFGWTSDRRFLIYHRNVKELAGNRLQIWTIAVETGQVKPLEPAIPKLNRIVGVPSDGKQIFFLGWNEAATEVWVMENFLPPVAVAK